MNEDINVKLSELIKNPDLERLELELKTSNFFTILRASNQEIRHSNFLAWLLDPKESHNLGQIFIKWFLKDIFSDSKISWANEFMADSLDLADVKVYREWQNIDILIVTKDFVICIENKVYSKEHSDQLSKYRAKINQNFPNREKAFVYLSPTGLIPENEEDSKTYVIYSYDEIVKNIEIILDVYSKSLSEKIRYYLEDYLLIVRRDIMKNHESIELAKQIYLNHKEALDFIFENKPDRISNISPIVESILIEKGYIMGSSNKGFNRFLTQKLNEVIPRTGQDGWSLKESFLFEINYWPKTIVFKTVISPGNQHNRNLLSSALEKTLGSKKPSGTKFLAHFNKSKKIDVTDEQYEDDEKIKEAFKNLIEENERFISEVEKNILDISKDFQY